MNTADMADEIARMRKERDELREERDKMAALAEDRRKFIVNGVETGNILPPWYEDDPASSIYKGCNLEPSFAADAHDARVKAEALEGFVAESLLERKTFFFDSELMDAAKQYREQAEGE